jgi:ATP-independent RNA helicase DbpA
MGRRVVGDAARICRFHAQRCATAATLRCAHELVALTKDLGFAGTQIGKINVNEFSTHVAVERSIAPDVLRKLSSAKVKGRSVKLRLLEG